MEEITAFNGTLKVDREILYLFVVSLPLVYLSLLLPYPLVLLHTDARIIWLYAEPMIDRVFYSLRTHPIPRFHPSIPTASRNWRSISIFPEIFPSRNVDNFVRLGTGCRMKFLFGIRKNILVKYLFHHSPVCRFYISFFFLSFFFYSADDLNIGWVSKCRVSGIRIILIDVSFLKEKEEVKIYFKFWIFCSCCCCLGNYC